MFRYWLTVPGQQLLHLSYYIILKYWFQVHGECVRGFWAVLVTDVWVLQPEIWDHGTMMQMEMNL